MSASASASASHQLLREPPLKFFLGGMFFVPQGIGFLILLWPWPLLSRSSRGSVFHRNGFFPNFVKSTRGILIKCVRELHRHVAHDLIIVDLQLTYFCIYCVVLKLAILWPWSLSSKNYKLNLVPTYQKPWAVIKNSPDYSWPLLTYFCDCK